MTFHYSPATISSPPVIFSPPHSSISTSHPTGTHLSRGRSDCGYNIGAELSPRDPLETCKDVRHEQDFFPLLHPGLMTKFDKKPAACQTELLNPPPPPLSPTHPLHNSHPSSTHKCVLLLFFAKPRLPVVLQNQVGSHRALSRGTCGLWSEIATSSPSVSEGKGRVRGQPGGFGGQGTFCVAAVSVTPGLPQITPWTE
ncbi:hypothetical protein C0Q70_14781 [Pomacea canaliculata]|uniref:Uncharacterized protein n=1 Tax=Pomacea canaliculata TaxID=400727 RepID=A0A2T7NSZ8_POMCA|nr:hypothetical protein C0Q70_14781 [Pomacea canaliculata]